MGHQMGRVTEFIDFINREKTLDADEQVHFYNYMSITDRIKKIRKENRRKINKESKCREEG